MSFITGNITLKCSSRSEQASIRITGDADVVYTETEPNSKSLLLFAKKALEGTVTCSLGNVEHVWNYKFIGKTGLRDLYVLPCAIVIVH